MSVCSSDNCSLWCSSGASQVCHLSRHDESTLWHKHIGQMHMTAIQKVLSNNAILGLPLSFKRDNCLSDYNAILDLPLFFKRDIVYRTIKQASKFTCLTIRCLILFTSHVLELIHMDLIRPMQNKKFWRKEICPGMCRWFLLVHPSQISSQQIKDLYGISRIMSSTSEWKELQLCL